MRKFRLFLAVALLGLLPLEVLAQGAVPTLAVKPQANGSDVSDANPLATSNPALIASINNLISALNQSIPSGTNPIGRFAADHTTPGVTDAWQDQDGQPVTNSCSASCAGTALLGPFEMTGYKSLHFAITGVGGGASIQLQVSNDLGLCSAATNWFTPLPAYFANQTIATPTINFNFLSAFTAPRSGRCMRLYISSYTSGTYSASGYQSGSPALAVVPLTPQSPTPASGTQVTNSATGTTAAISAALPAVSNKTNYLCGLTVTSAGTTSPAPVTVTITGTISGTMSYVYFPPTSGQGILNHTFSPCVQASAVNTAIQVNVPALGAGSTVAANLHGYYP